MDFDILFFVWDTIVRFLALTWWFWLFFILLWLARDAWLTWRQHLYKHAIKWVFLEIKIPRENKRSPQGMEQVLSAIHAMGNYATDLQEIYWDGEVTRWTSFEMVSFGGEIHFYLRTIKSRRKIVEAAFFAYYPDVELIEVPDYTPNLPQNVKEVYAQGLDIWGGEMKISKSAMYPIKSYHDFEAVAEEKEFDPISSFLEVLGKLHEEEFVGLQLHCYPVRHWEKEFEHVVEKLKEPKIKEDTSGSGDLAKAFGRFVPRSPGETDVLKAVERNLSKPAFVTAIRFLYFSPRASFSDTYPRRGILGAFNQYGVLDLNKFEINYPRSTRAKFWNFPYLFPGRRNEYRKNRMIHDYIYREIEEHTFLGKLINNYIMDSGFKMVTFPLNIEALATLFHPPTAPVLTAPHLKRVESRKGSPPAGLAIFGEEEAIEKFQ